ncbi:MAG TPA: hypothetical protein VFL82_00050 [Thermomicrobiales bacterium]|nr:hypothetical protein [Thermomicrobiales bacterium]
MLIWFCCLLLVAGLFGVAVPTAGQAEELHHAGLVVRHGDGQLTYAYVTFTEDEISGTELLKRTGIPVVTVSFGGLGEGICEIEREGCPASDCRKRVCQGRGNDSPFWQYFRQTSPGTWQPLVLGASSIKVRDGDVDGWSWTPKAPNLPALTLADVARLAGAADASSVTAGVVPTAAVRSSAGPAAKEDARQNWLTIAGGGVILLGLAGAALLAIRRARHTRGAT